MVGSRHYRQSGCQLNAGHCAPAHSGQWPCVRCGIRAPVGRGDETGLDQAEPLEEPADLGGRAQQVGERGGLVVVVLGRRAVGGHDGVAQNQEAARGGGVDEAGYECVCVVQVGDVAQDVGEDECDRAGEIEGAGGLAFRPGPVVVLLALVADCAGAGVRGFFGGLGLAAPAKERRCA